MSSSLVPSSRQRTWTRFSYLQDALPPQTVKTGGDWTDDYLRALLLAQLSIVVSPDRGIGNHHEPPARE